VGKGARWRSKETFMLRSSTARRIGLVGLLLASQLLSACVIVPRPYYRPRGYAVEQPAYGGWSRDPYYYGHRRGDDRDGFPGWNGERRDRPGWDGGR
jgi:hypothetical protein